MQHQGKRSQDVKSSFDVTDDLEHVTALSYTSHIPLNDRNPAQSTTSLHPQHSDDPSQTLVAREGQVPQQVYSQKQHQKQHPRSSSWDLLGGARKINEAYEQFDPRNASEQHLVFADGDIPNSKFARFYQFLLSVSIVTRWTLFIIPVLAIVWIPGIIGLTASHSGEIWGVRLIWWSIWLSVVWGGWWACLAGAMILPSIVRHTVGVVAVGARRYIDWLGALRRYVAFVAWTAAIWIAYSPLINSRQDKNSSPKNRNIISFVGKFLFGLYLCAALLLFEKFSIQWIAAKFHERSYAERIAEQKFAVKTLTTLYRHSTDLHERNHPYGGEKQPMINPKRIVKQAIRGVRFAATTTTTALGNVASEIAGSSVLQPNSPQAMVKTALESASKTKLLAHRLFHSFRKSDRDYMVFQDINRFFPSLEEADGAFTLFDRDGNGDVSLEEVEQACAEIHREQLSIEHSMSDLDSAVGRLDNLFMSLYVIVAALIIAVTLEAQLASLITATGTLVLGLSWLIGSSLHDILTSIIFLFVRHPFDVGDRIDLGAKGGGTFTVKEIRLLSTILLNGHGGHVQVSNNVLADLFIENIRRSPKMSESFSFDVHYSTTFKQIERLRSLMLGFVQMERRDFEPSFDVIVLDIPEQEKMTLQADIMFKSNWQQGALKTTRRNKWICALKTYLAEVKIYGPKGDPDKIPDTGRYTIIPWEEVRALDNLKKGDPVLPIRMPEMPSGGYDLINRSVTMLDDTGTLFDESGTTQSPRRPVEMPSAGGPVARPAGAWRQPGEEIEMIARE